MIFPSNRFYSNETEHVLGGFSHRQERARTLPPEFTPPVDNVIIESFMPHAEWVAQHGVTPNHMSILGAILAVAALCALYYGYMVTFVLLFAASYALDALDGWMARTFALYSPWGEALDHWKDIMVTVALVLVILFRVRPSSPIIAILVITYAISFIGEACSQYAIEERKAAAGIHAENVIGGMARMCPHGANPATTRWIATPVFLLAVGSVILITEGMRAVGYKDAK